ncbi:hypothetical protein LPJ61_001429 [Coemansia biformis]|uniref:Uncharacterized protein n=1 Tax=Coemansia biformis TaxID=1286918 RepID=A0A9W8CZL4_9FUNG|nr:hypothetical protein LPJ61_001429 [Coemansia biformis]
MDPPASRQLFVKVDEVVYQSGPSPGRGGIRTQVFKHSDSNLRIVLCNSTQPLFSANIYVPTIPPNDKGLPHTLEHLVFCGSKRFPHRGYLDLLANCNLAQGTNAWTSYDHTCYTFSAASEQAVANVLPVYLDHVLSPLLRDDHFTTEVYHYDDAGREQGVVFSEILAIENEEYELATFSLERLMFPAQSAYSRSYGGLTRDIAALSNQEIIDYHRRFYDADNVTVVLTGPFSERFERQVLQTIPPEIIQSNGCDTRSPIDCSPPPAHQCRSRHVPFPSSDADMGSVAIGWRGPPAEDVETLLALDVLLLYLADDPSSPLCQRFVERPSPLANEVSAHIMHVIPAAIVMYFGGVPYPQDDEAGSGGGSLYDGSDANEGSAPEESDCGSECGSDGEDPCAHQTDDPDIPHLFDEGYFKDILVDELRRIHDTQFGGDARALEDAAQKHIQRSALDMEDDPSATLNELVGVDIVASHFSPGHRGQFSIGSRARMFDAIAELGRRPVQYWLDLLKKWLIDGQLYHVVMVPDPDLGGRLDDERKAAEQENAAKIGDKDAHASRIAQAAASQVVDLPSELQQAIPQADPLRAAYLPHELVTVAPPQPLGPVSIIQVVKTETTLPNLRLCIPMDALPAPLRPYLVLFHGLMMSTDLVLPAGVIYDTETDPLPAERRVDYTTVDKRLSELTSSSGDSIGIEMATFSHCWLGELYSLTMRVPEGNFEVAVRWMVQALVFADFTAERIIATAQNLLSTLLRTKQEGDTVLAAASTRLTTNCRPGKPDWIERHVSLFDQERALNGIIDAAKKDRLDEVTGSLDAIKQALIHSRGGFLALGIPSGGDHESYIATFAREWGNCSSNYAGGPPEAAAESSSFAESGPFPVARESRFPKLDAPLLVHLPMKPLQASYASITIEMDLHSTPNGVADFEDELQALPAKDFYAVYLLTALLQRADGPLSQAVRGKGYAYGASLSTHSWTGKLTLGFSRASDVSRAILAARQVIADVGENWGSHVSDFEIAMTRSAMVYDEVAALSTPESIVLACIEGGLLGYKSVEQRARWRNAHLAAVTQDDLRRAYEQHISRFLDPAVPAITVAVTPLDTELLPELGVFERKTLDGVGAYRLL